MRSGFSLLELSVSLVIIGLLSGSILAGKNLMRASELRAVISQMESFRTGTNVFRDRYFALPGDMPNATKYWGKQAGDPAKTGPDNVCSAIDTSMKASLNPNATCDGDGDKLISGTLIYPPNYPACKSLLPTDPGFCVAPLGGYYERCRYWQHLALAGMIPGNYTGICVLITGVGTSATQMVPGENVPGTRMGDGYFQPLLGSDLSSVAGIGFSKIYPGNNISVSGWTDRTVSSAQALFTPTEAYKIDRKMDDGSPSMGFIQSNNNFFRKGQLAPNPMPTPPPYMSNCVNPPDNTITIANAAYQTETESKECILFMAIK